MTQDSGLRTQDSGLRTQDSGLRTQDSGLRTNYALMKYRSLNIGDEIQSIAASRFLPHIDDYVFREHLDSFRVGSRTNFKTILNGWYMHCPKHFPPSEAIDPLLVSVHFDRGIRKFIAGSKASMNYLRQYGPVGCRDTDTMHFLLEHDVPAYHSGCMTLTLTENKTLKSNRKDEYILCVDVPDEIVENVRSRTNKPVHRLTKTVNPHVESLDRLELAKIYLYVYHNASAVITSNLHTTLPCLAFNVPVCLVADNDGDGRFCGLDTLVHHCTTSDFVSRKVYDINNPPENPQDFTVFRDALVETCRNFTGYDSGQPVFEDDYTPDVLRMLQIMQYNPEGAKKGLFWVSGQNLLRAAMVKAWHKFLPPATRLNQSYEYNCYERYLK